MSAYQNDSKVRNEIVTLRGGVCLVVREKPKSHHRDGMNKNASSEAVCSKELKSGADRLQAVLVQ